MRCFPASAMLCAFLIVFGVPAQAAVIGGRPAGCPHRFCGCALALKVYGRIIPRLNLAANWKGLPRAMAAPGMVAARYGHVFQLQSYLGGSKWMVWDPNSGGGRIRIHARSIAGYTIHNPHGGLAALGERRVRHARHYGKRVRYANAQ